jgi:hypothetical protein
MTVYASPTNPGHIIIPPYDGKEYAIKDGQYVLATGGAQKISGEEGFTTTLKPSDKEVVVTLSNEIKEILNKADENVYTKEQIEDRLMEEVRSIFVGNTSHEYYTYTKTNIAANQELTILKPHDPNFKSAILGVQEFIEGETVTELGRAYDNGSKSCFNPNPYVSFDDGLSLITSKVIEMTPVRTIAEMTLFKCTIDPTEWLDFAIIN